MKKNFIIIKRGSTYLLLSVFLIFNSILLAEENTQQQEQKLVNDNQKGFDVKIELKDDKNLTKGIKLLTDDKYEKSAIFFEKYLLSNIESLDQLFGLGLVSFTMIPSKLNEGAKYFQKKIENSPENYRLYYYKAIFEIMSLEIMNFSRDQTSNNYLEIVKRYKPNSQKTHYILGLIYLLQGNHELYLNECAYLKDKNLNLSNRLKSVYDESQFFKKILKEVKREN